MIGYGNSMFLATHGILARSASGGAVDPDAQAFITAASITDPTQQSAINQLVVDLKGYSIWTKMKALYPFVGGTASAHKWNLKDPRDLDAAFRLVFSGGWTHSSTGALPNGTNAYADTFFNQTTNFTSTSNASIGVYLRTNNASTGADMGAGDTGSARQGMLIFSSFAGTYYGCAMGDTFIAPAPSNSDSRGFYSVVRNSGVQSLHKRGNITLNVSETEAVGSVTNETIWVGGGTSGGYNFSSRETAFNFIGDALTQSEINNFYTAVQAFQTTIGRSIGTQTVSDADAQAFVTNAGIVDQVEATAINNLVIGMKADGLWTKMKAIYPFVGGTSTTHKYNLVNPLDTDAAFRLVFSGGWTHSSTGATPNGTNGYADTKLIAQNVLGLNSTSYGVYSRTNVDRNAPSIGNVTGGASAECSLWLRSGNLTYLRVNNPSASSQANSDSRGLFIANRVNSTQINLQIRGTQYTFSQNSNSLYVVSFHLGGVNPNFFDTKELAFAFIADGLTSQNMTNLDTRVITFQTALSRNV